MSCRQYNIAWFIRSEQTVYGGDICDAQTERSLHVAVGR